MLAEAMARELGPKGVHAAYVMIDAVIDLEWTRKRWPDAPDDFFITPAAIAEEVWHIAHQDQSAWSFNVELRPFGETWRTVTYGDDGLHRMSTGQPHEGGIMSTLRIFSYLPNPRVWKATIAARLCGIDGEVRGVSPKELASWLWDFDARPLSSTELADSSDVQVGKVGLAGTRLHKTGAFLEAHPFGAVPAAFSPDGKTGIFE